MENTKLNHIVNTTIKYRLNPAVIKAQAINAPDKQSCVQVTQIFGVNVLWPLSPFRATDIYEYFETQLLSDILEYLLDDDSIWEYCQRHENVIAWLREEAYDAMRTEMKDFIMVTVNMDWDVFFQQIINQMGKNGFLSASIYYNLIAGYFESIAKHYFEIDLKKAKYATPQGTGVLTITFFDDSKIKIHKDFFTGFQFFNELTRETTTENFLSNIKNELRKVICRQKST